MAKKGKTLPTAPGLNEEAWEKTHSPAKECYAMKLDLFTNPTVVDDAKEIKSMEQWQEQQLIGHPNCIHRINRKGTTTTTTCNNNSNSASPTRIAGDDAMWWFRISLASYILGIEKSMG